VEVGGKENRNNNNKRQTASQQTNKLQKFSLFSFWAVDKITRSLDADPAQSFLSSA